MEETEFKNQISEFRNSERVDMVKALKSHSRKRFVKMLIQQLNQTPPC
jgi:hypothetical protein